MTEATAPENEPALRRFLREEVAAALARVVAHPDLGPVRGRNPELAIYVLNYRLRARAYWAASGTGTAAAQYAVTSPEVAADLRPGGVLFEALARAVDQRRSELEGGSVLAVTLELQTRSGAAVLGERRSPGRAELARFVHTPEGFRPVT